MKKDFFIFVQKLSILFIVLLLFSYPFITDKGSRTISLISLIINVFILVAAIVVNKRKAK